MLPKGSTLARRRGAGSVRCLGDNMHVEFRGEPGGVSEVVHLQLGKENAG